MPIERQLADVGDRAALDPVLSVEGSVAVEGALALLMARLTPDRLAAYVLRKGFGYAYTELASVLRMSASKARVVMHWAQACLESGQERPVPVESHRRLAAAFRTAAQVADANIGSILGIGFPGSSCTARASSSVTGQPAGMRRS
ncbi:hypothetical protein ACIRP3_01355 [Streptomyces sp. NPDC101209]|uniref:hypothetical protein n=1 Tax=Streptomyces sp. NPDC101209 TaxID=3366129 RepID=UPI0038017A74